MMLEGRLRAEVLEEVRRIQGPSQGVSLSGEHCSGNSEVDPNCFEQDTPGLDWPSEVFWLPPPQLKGSLPAVSCCTGPAFPLSVHGAPETVVPRNQCPKSSPVIRNQSPGWLGSSVSTTEPFSSFHRPSQSSS